MKNSKVIIIDSLEQEVWAILWNLHHKGIDIAEKRFQELQGKNCLLHFYGAISFLLQLGFLELIDSVIRLSEIGKRELSIEYGI